MTPNDVRVLVVAFDPLARAGLAALLSGQPGCQVVGQVGEETDLAAALDIYRPEVVIWDLGWEPAPESPVYLPAGLERLTELEGEGPPIVALLPDRTYADEVRTAGALGLLPRDVGAERLVAALLAAAQGLVVVDPSLIASLPGGADPSSASIVETLTPRELDVLQLLAEGLSNKAVARRLGISEHTVKFHVNAIMGKLGAQSRTEAVVSATRLGLILL